MLFPPSRVFNGFDGMEVLTTGSLSKLTFFNVSDADYGNYTCVAINKLGSSNTSFLLYGKETARSPFAVTFSTDRGNAHTDELAVILLQVLHKSVPPVH